MKPVTIKPVMNSQKPVSAMTVNTQVRTGVNKIRREVQTSAAIYIGDTTEMTINLSPGEVFSLDEVLGVSALSLTTSGRIDFTHKPNNTHDHTLSIEQQFSCDYLLTSIQLANPSTVDSVSVSLVYVPFTGTLPEEQPCGGVDPVPEEIPGVLSWWDVVPEPDTSGETGVFPTLVEDGRYRWAVQLQLDKPVYPPPMLVLSFDNVYENPTALKTMEFDYIPGQSDEGSGSYVYFLDMAQPEYTGTYYNRFGRLVIHPKSREDVIFNVPAAVTQDLPRKAQESSASPRYLGWLPTPQSVSKIDFFYYIPTQASSYSSSIKQTNNQSSSNGVISINSATKILTITLDTLSLSDPSMPIDRVSLYDEDAGTWESANIFAYAINAFEVEHNAFSDGVSTKINFRASMTSAYEVRSKEWPVFKFGGFVMDSGGGGESIGNIIVPMTKLWLWSGYHYTQFGAVFVKSFSSVSSGYLTYDIGFVSPITNNTEWFRYPVQNISYVDSDKMLSLAHHDDQVINTTGATLMLAYSVLWDRSHLGFSNSVSVYRVSSLQQGLLPPTIKDDAHDPYITYSAVITDYDTQHRPIQGATRGVISFSDYRNGLNAYDLDGTTQVLFTFKGQGVGLVGDLRNCTINYFNPD